MHRFHDVRRRIQSGLIHPGRNAALGALVLALAMLAASAAAAPGDTLDAYGGVTPSVAPATGFFQVKQVGDRWMFVTPEGNGMWMTGVFGVTYVDAEDDLAPPRSQERIVTKYGGGSDWQDNWRINTARRLKTWGFNTLAEYHHWGMRPGPLSGANPERMPYVHIINPARTVLYNGYGYGTGPVKDLVIGTDPRYYDGYRGARALDFFDPNWETYVDGWMRLDDGLIYGAIGSPWLLGIAMDEGDSLLGFGPGPEIPFPRGFHPHPGWMVLVTSFEQANNPWAPESPPYADRTVHSKYALRDFLKDRYAASIDALNSAWNSHYTTYDSEGGWGSGTGLLDEDGRNPWVGTWRDEMATASPAVRADLGDFLYLYARRYFTVMAAKMRQHAPMHLVFGPTSLNGWAALTRKEILRAAGESVDVLQAAIGSPRALDLTATYAGNKPIVTWDSFIANPDSALHLYRQPEDIAAPRLAETQEARGQMYADKVDFLFNATTPAGVHPVAGIKFWSWTDHWWEKANFGLVTLSDNAYDGQQAARNPGTDAAGWPTGGEEPPLPREKYGDFISAVTAANARVAQSLGGIGPASNLLLQVDVPADGARVRPTVGIGGWAFDGQAPIGPGVDVVRIFYGAACSGTVLADATLGIARPDVQAAYALGSTFGATGFAATVTLPASGAHQVTVCARSTITATFAAHRTLSLTTGARRRLAQQGGVTESRRLVRPAAPAAAARRR
jgi:hypothetical protein